MEPLTLQKIADYSRGVLHAHDPARSVAGVVSDSRETRTDELFLALRGENFDGHRFVETVAVRGAAGAIVESSFASGSLPEQFALIRVDDSLLGYQRLAAAYRRTMPCKVVAITGSNGKTSTKDLTAAVLASRYSVLKTSGNLNNHVGVPRTLLAISARDEFAVVEMGMNHPGEIAPLARMAAPDVAIITNIGTAHIEYMHTRAAIAQEKGALVEAVGASGHVVLPAEDDYAPSLAERTRARIVTVGFERGDLRAENVRSDMAGTVFTLVSGEESVEVRLPIPGKHMVLNSLLAVAAGTVCGISLPEAAEGLASVNLTKGRLEFKQVGDLHFLDDSYNANPDSMVAALETLSRLPVKGRRIAILGRMGELGSEAMAGNRRVGAVAAREGIDHLVAVGADAGHLVQSARSAGLTTAIALSSVEEAGAWLRDFARPADLILIKGSRSAGMEQILDHIGETSTAGNS